MKKTLYYLCPAFAQITAAALAVFILTNRGYECGYMTVPGMR